MARLYRDATLQHQIDLTLARLILEGVDVRVYAHCTLQKHVAISLIKIYRVQLASTFNKMSHLL